MHNANISVRVASVTPADIFQKMDFLSFVVGFFLVDDEKQQRVKTVFTKRN